MGFGGGILLFILVLAGGGGPGLLGFFKRGWSDWIWGYDDYGYCSFSATIYDGWVALLGVDGVWISWRLISGV